MTQKGSTIESIHANKNIGTKQGDAAIGMPFAEIVVWKWNQNAQQVIIAKHQINRDESKQLNISTEPDDIYLNIRLLTKRSLEKKFYVPPLDADDDFTITVGNQQFVVSAARLKQVSPVFRAMLRDEVREKAERKVEIEDTNPVEFRAFLEAISLEQTVLPNSLTVCGLLKLADRYQVDFLKKRFEENLMHCVEIPLIELIKLADQYNLDNMHFLLSIDAEKLRSFCRAHYAELHKLNRNLVLDLFQGTL